MVAPTQRIISWYMPAKGVDQMIRGPCGKCQSPCSGTHRLTTSERKQAVSTFPSDENFQDQQHSWQVLLLQALVYWD